VKRVPGGPVSNWLHDTLKPGDTVRALGPMGEFTCFAHPSARTVSPGFRVSCSQFETGPPGTRFTVIDTACGRAPEPRRYAYAPGQFLTFAFEIGGETVHRCYTLSSDRHGVRPGRRRGEGVAAMHRLAADLEGEGQELASAPTRPHAVSITVKRVPGGPVSNWLHDTLKPGGVTPLPPESSRYFCAGWAKQVNSPIGPSARTVSPAFEIGGETVHRCYTLSSAPTRPHAVSITVKRVPCTVSPPISKAKVRNWPGA
jgi:ferredoxin-NADP reductase